MAKPRRYEEDARRPVPGRRSGPGPELPPWGSLAGRLGIAIVIGSALLGAVATMLTGSEPGAVLGVFLIAGTAAAALGVRPRAVYLIIPAPALCYVGAAAVAGLLLDRGADTSRTALAVSAAQWVASGFVTMTVATLLAIAVMLARRRSRDDAPGRRHRPAGAGEPTGSARAGRR